MIIVRFTHVGASLQKFWVFRLTTQETTLLEFSLNVQVNCVQDSTTQLIRKMCRVLGFAAHQLDVPVVTAAAFADTLNQARHVGENTLGPSKSRPSKLVTCRLVACTRVEQNGFYILAHLQIREVSLIPRWRAHRKLEVEESTVGHL